MSIIKHVTLQKIVAHVFRYDPRIYMLSRLIQFVVAECTRVSLLNRSTCQCNRTRYLCSNQRKETIRLEVFTTFVDFNSTDNNT